MAERLNAQAVLTVSNLINPADLFLAALHFNVSITWKKPFT